MKVKKTWLACNTLSRSLWCWHPIWALVKVQVALLPSQLFGNMAGIAAAGDSNVYAAVTHVKDLDAVLGSWICPGSCGYLSKISENKSSLILVFVSSSLSL